MFFRRHRLCTDEDFVNAWNNCDTLADVRDTLGYISNEGVRTMAKTLRARGVALNDRNWARGAYRSPVRDARTENMAKSFVEIWNKCETVNEFCQLTGYRCSTAVNRASDLRVDGYPVKRMGRAK